MTNLEKFSKKIIIEENKDYVYKLELWGASTKHPDSIFYYSDWKNKIDSDIIEPKYQVLQWLCYCASVLNFPTHAKLLCEYALENWSNWDE